MFRLSHLGECGSFNENHVKVFFTQLILLAAVFFALGCVALTTGYPKGYDIEKVRFKSYLLLFESHGEEHKELPPCRETSWRSFYRSPGRNIPDSRR